MSGRPGGRGPLRRYRALSVLAAPLLHGWVARVARQVRRDPGAPAGEARRFVRERTGRYEGAPGGGASGGAERIWLHCASVGETVAALPLIEALGEREGVLPLVTTATPTGARVLAERAPPGTRHRYLPIDRPGPVARFLDAERPDRAGIVETEIWPWLFAVAKARGVRLSILSGRLSARTLERLPRVLAPVYREALAGVEVLARSEADAGRYLALGAEPGRVVVAGDLKDAGTAPVVGSSPLPCPYVLAASTHADEESRLARAWVRRGAERPGLLVIAPRHPERGDEVHAALLAAAPVGTGVARRSRGEEPALGDVLYLADTLGELDRWYAHASAAFVGGSLVERGGHNLLEPARVGTPCVVGPHTSNFAEVRDALVAAGAIVVARGAEEVATTLRAGLDGEGTVRELGARSYEVGKRRAEGRLGYYLRAFAMG